jgi:hypothetical protein
VAAVALAVLALTVLELLVALAVRPLQTTTRELLSRIRVAAAAAEARLAARVELMRATVVHRRKAAVVERQIVVAVVAAHMTQ